MGARKSYQPWGDREVAKLKELRASGRSSREIAQALKRSVPSIERKCQAESIEWERSKVDDTSPDIPDWKSRATTAEKRCDELLGQLERLRNRKAITFQRGPSRSRKRGTIRATISDTHGKRVCKPAFAAFTHDLEIIQPRHGVHIGDIVDCDGFLSTHHALGYVSQSEYSYEEDYGAANDQLDSMAKASAETEWEIVEGNHDYRPLQWIRDNTKTDHDRNLFIRTLYAPHVLGLEARGIAYHSRGEHHDGLRARGTIKRGKCLFVHGNSHAKRAAEAHLRGCGTNVVFGHTHRAEELRLSTEATGIIGAWNPGCLCELHPMWRHSLPSDWSHGYGLQFEEPGGDFLHINVPIIDGRSLLRPMLKVLGVKG